VLTSYWDGVAESTDALPAGWRRHAREQHLALLARWVQPRGRWLKTDLFEERAAERALLPALDGAAWIGIDISAGVAGRARDLVGAAVTVADVRVLPFASAMFDGVLSTSTLDHFEHRDDIGHALRELRRVLHPEGRLVLTLDNPRNPLIRLRNALPPAVSARTGLVPFQVGATLDEADGRRLIESCGFVVERASHLLHAPHVVGTRPARWGWYERRVLPRTERLATTRLAPITGHFVAFSARAV
jgi:SAM-dependent methyltransferase